MKGEMRTEWIKAISKHQEFDYISTYFMICELHFKPNDIIMKDGRRTFQGQVVPSIFVYPSSLNVDNSHSLEAGIENSVCKIKHCSVWQNEEERPLFFR